MTEATDTPDQDAGAGEGPLFSFLTTAYKSEDTLPRTIQSVLTQTMGDWELIVVDNGMSEAIVDVVRPHLTDERIHLVRQENRGPLGGVEGAAEVATGRHFVVLNSDDAITPEFCEVMARTLEAHPDAAAVTCDAVVVDVRDGVPWRKSYLQAAGKRHLDRIGRPLRLADVIDGPCPYYTGAIRRDVWTSLGGMSASVPRLGDLAFWLGAITSGHDVLTIGDQLCIYSIAADSVSRPVDDAEQEVYVGELEAELTRAARTSEHPEDAQALDRVLGRLHYQRTIRRARTALLNGEPEEALEQARDAFHTRRTVRAAGLVVGLRVSPSLLARVHPIKNDVQERASIAARRVKAWRARRDGSGSPSER